MLSLGSADGEQQAAGRAASQTRAWGGTVPQPHRPPPLTAWAASTAWPPAISLARTSQVHAANLGPLQAPPPRCQPRATASPSTTANRECTHCCRRTGTHWVATPAGRRSRTGRCCPAGCPAATPPCLRRDRHMRVGAGGHHAQRCDQCPRLPAAATASTAPPPCHAQPHVPCMPKCRTASALYSASSHLRCTNPRDTQAGSLSGRHMHT
jgi:hypothetical protein